MSALKVSASSFNPNKGKGGAKAPISKGSGVCGCYATQPEHECIGSCLGCGRIYCSAEEELVGKQCVFCQAPSVFAPVSAEEISRDSLGGIMPEQLPGVEKAYAVKDRLLQFDRENARRTHVHDAQADYYESSTWLSPEEKAAIDAKRKRARNAKLPSQRRYIMKLNENGKKITANTIVLTKEEEEEGEDENFNAPPEAEALEAPPLNSGLEGNKEKAGDVYRLLTESLAPWRTEKTTAL